MNPKISVIIANYNNADYLHDCLDSVASQSFTDLECIVVDDGSTDDSKKIIRQFARRDKRFRTVFQENRGVSAARNVGLDMARGEWIFFLDSDDCACPGALDTLYSLGVQNNADIVGGGGVRVFDDFKPMPAAAPEPANPQFIFFSNSCEDIIKMSMLGETHRFVWVWRRLFRRDLIGSLRFDEALYPGEDTCFMFELIPRAARICESRAMVVFHRLSKTAVSNAAFNQKYFAYATPTLLRMRKIMDAYYQPAFHKYFYSKFLDLIMTETVCKSLMSGRLMRQAAAVLRPVFGTRALPLKYMPFVRRVIFWLFMKVFG
ncbi:MAG: glycosyltransferase family 2 protein [Rickettsiales bacterium]|jgi:glycosyltransferase involved in cell wall biosynthesis|nr:glycosyltransferase family 2 protein [Rickettsiales bacterium]